MGPVNLDAKTEFEDAEKPYVESTLLKRRLSKKASSILGV